MNLMLDIETYATTMDACVMTIGAVVFDKRGKIHASFYRRIRGESCDALGLYRDPKTVEFWTHQSQSSRLELETDTDRVDIKDAVNDFTVFWKDNNCSFLWCNGANFDEPIMSTVYHKLGIEKPWRFFNVRCVRTLLSMARIKTGDLGPTTHHAIEDCKKQITGVIMSLKILNISLSSI